MEQGEYVVNIKVSDIISKNYVLNEGKVNIKVSDLITFTAGPRDGTPINNVKKSDKKHGVLLEKNIVPDKAQMRIILPDGDKVQEAKIAIYDNVGNVVFEKSTIRDGKTTWNLHNSRVGKSLTVRIW
jgi:hypothetical protein